MKTIKVKDIDPKKHVVIEKAAFEALLETAKKAKRFLLNGAPGDTGPGDGDPTIRMRMDEAALYEHLKNAIAQVEEEL